VKLDKALYGCVESARLWFNDVSSHLKSLEFMQSEVDPCVFFKMEDGHTTIIIIYVDDFLMSSKELKHLNSLIESLQTRYKSISVTYGPVIEYLGMNLNFSTPNQVTITMKNKIETILDSYSIASSVVSPATDQIFKIRDLPLLSPSLQISIESTVAKLLYIATHVRPDILLPVNFLCSRSEKFDEDDQSKLIRILKYLHGTSHLGITLKSETSKPFHIDVFADAAFAIHSSDRRSHSGLCIQIGSSTILCKSGKQSLVTTSSTESELVACADVIPYVEGVRKLLKELNFPSSSTVIHQDNISTIRLIENKKTAVSTNHAHRRKVFLPSGETSIGNSEHCSHTNPRDDSRLLHKAHQWAAVCGPSQQDPQRMKCCSSPPSISLIRHSSRSILSDGWSCTLI
jgi:hypothetical protein